MAHTEVAAASRAGPATEPVPRGADGQRTAPQRTALRTCPLCEAGCGLELTLDGDRVTRIRGDRDDVFSAGFICPKGTTLGRLHDDPDRLRTPLVRRGGELVEATWSEALAAVAEGLGRVTEAHGRDATAIYVGNPNAHNLAGMLYMKPLIKALGTTQVYSASTVDQRPKEIASGLMFGPGLIVPVPDVDRTDHLFILGANPYASNGSLATAPDWPGRIEALRARGGRLVVADPRRSRTAAEADDWVALRPGSDPLLLAAMVTTLVEEGLVDAGDAAPHLAGLDDALGALAEFSPEAVAEATGIAADDIRRLARDLAGADRAVVYGRIGTTTAPFGTVTSWLVDVLNIATGNLDRAGGAMFTKAAAGAANTRGEPGRGRGLTIGRRHTRVRGLPESMGEFPVACLAEEIDTPGEGEVRALVTVAGNPVLSTPNGDRLDAALEGLEFMVSVDIYRHETTRHADVVLPAPSPLEKGHYDIALAQLGLRNVANWSDPVLGLPEGEPDEWETLARLALIAQGQGPDADPAVVDDLVIGSLLDSAIADEHGPVHGRDPDELLASLGDETGPARVVDAMLRLGPYGEGFGADPDGLSLAKLRANPHGIDLGALEPRLPECLRTLSGKVEMAPEEITADLGRLAVTLDDPGDGLLLVGRRHLRSNNSWMHNIEVLVKGKDRCTLWVHPDDAARLGLADKDPAEVTSRVASLEVAVEVTDELRPGVVSLPHGWGHDAAGTEQSVAREHAGVNANRLTDELAVDAVSGNAVLNAIPVEVTPVSATAP